MPSPPHCPLPLEAGKNAGATAWLSWSAEALVPDLAPAPGSTPRLHVRLSGVESVEAAEALILWTPSGLEPSGYQAASWGAPTGTDCTWLLRGQSLTLEEASDSTIRIATSASGQDPTCSEGNVFFVDLQPTVAGEYPPGRFVLASVQVVDDEGGTDVLIPGSTATIHLGATEPAPIVRTRFPATGWTGRAVDYFLTGYHFLPTFQARLERAGRMPLVGAVTRLDDRRASVSFAFTDADTGLWDLVAANLGGRETRRADAIQVVKLADPDGEPQIDLVVPQATIVVDPGSLPLLGPRPIRTGDLTAGDPALLAEIQASGAETIQCLWPELTPQATTAVQPDGRTEALFDFGNAYLLSFASEQEAQSAVEELASHPLVARARVVIEKPGPWFTQSLCPTQSLPDCIFQVPDDPSFMADPVEQGTCGQWYLVHDSECTGGTHNEDTNSPCAWINSKLRGNSSVVVGLLDSGIDTSHPDLAYTYLNTSFGDRILPGMNFTSDGGPTDVTDEWGHGTNMIGLTAARTGNGVSATNPDRGIAGVAGGWAATHPDSAGSRILPVKIGDRNGTVFPALIPGGINWAAQNGARVLNLSFAFPVPGTGPEDVDPLLREALFNAVKLGAVPVASMGNSNTSIPHYPAVFADWGLCTAVGATDVCGFRAELGPTQGSNTGPHIDLVAPGVNIFTTHPVNGAEIDNQIAESYREAEFGTSLSTALVSGVAASLLGAAPDLRDVDIQQVLRATAENTNPQFFTVPNEEIGHGRVDHLEAMKRVTGTTDTRVRISQTLSSPQLVNPMPTTITITSPDDPNIPEGTFAATRHEARFVATFPVAFRDGAGDDLSAWVHVVGTDGWSDDNPHLFNYGWGEVLDGTLSGSGATFVSYFYFLETENQWVPMDPNQATLRYAVLGTPTGTTDVGSVNSGRLTVSLPENPATAAAGVRFLIQGRPGIGVSAEVLDVSGRRVARIEDGASPEGRWMLRWDGKLESGEKAARGVYFVQVRQGEDRSTVKLVLVR